MIRILYFGDLKSSYLGSSDALKQTRTGIKFIKLADANEFRSAMLTEDPDFILFDYESDFNWRDFVSSEEYNPTIPFIILGTKISEDAVREAFRLGASDYLPATEISKLSELIFSMKEREFPVKRSDIIFKKIVENSSDGIMVLDRKGVITYASPSVETLLGYRPSEVLQLNLSHFLHPDDKVPVNEKITETLEKPGELVMGHTGRMRHKNGDWRWIEATGTNMLHDPDINGIIDTFRDVTDKVNESEKLQQNKELLTATLDALPLHIALLDANGLILTVNRAWINFALANGADQQYKATGQNYLEVCQSGINMGDAYANAAYLGISSVISGSQEEFEMEYPCDSPQGNRWFILHAKKFSSDADKTVVSHIEITGRKNAEENLKSSEIKFRMLLEQNRDGMALIGADMRPTYASPSIYGILGYTVSEVMKMDMLSYAHPDDIPVLYEVMGYAMQNPGVATPPKVTRMRAKNGEWKYIEGTLTNMFHDPLINAVIDNFRDVTEITIAHEKLVRSNRFFSIISRINQIVTQATTEEMFFNDVCKALVEIGLFSYSAIILSDEATQESNSVACEHNSVANSEPKNLDDLKIQLDAVIHDNVDYALIPDSRNDSPFGLFSGVFVPLRRGERTVGALLIEYTIPRQLVEDEMTLLSEIGNEISFMLQILDKDQARKNAEKQLEIKNAKLHQSHAMANLGSWEVDLEKGIADWSDEMLTMYGLPTENRHISYDQWFEMVHPEDRDHFELTREKARHSQTGYTIAHRIIRPDGAVRHIVSQLHLERDKKGRPTMMIGVAQDITDLQQIRKSLDASKIAAIQSENRYRQIVEMANEGICLINEENAIIFANQRFADMLGYAIEAIINKNLDSFLYPEDTVLGTSLAKIKHNSQPDRIEIRFQDEAGKMVWTTVALSAASDDSGKYNGAIALISNITEKRNADVENHFKANLLNTIGQAVAATNKDGIVTYWNNAAEDLYGRKNKDVVGRHFMDIVEPSLTKQGAQILDFTSSGKVWAGEIDILDESSKHHTYHVTARPIIGDNKEFGGMMAITTDISAQRRLEHLLKSSARLAKLGHFEIDLATNKLFRSDLADEIFNFPESKEKDIEKAINAYKEGESRNAIRNAYNAAINNGTSWDIEGELTPKDGKERWARSIGRVELIEGKAVRVFGSVQDISVHKASERAVLDAFKERDVILESIGDAFFAVDQNWRVRYWNANAERVFSMKRENILGKVLWDAFPEYINTQTYVQYHKAMETQLGGEFDEFFFTFQKWLQVSVYPSPLGLSTYLKDITERKLSELQLMELNENMQEYTNDLVAVNRELNQFSYIVSHNLRAPVTNIMGLVEELSDIRYDAETRSLFIDALRTSAKRLNIVITDLNDVLQLKTKGINNKEILELAVITEEVLSTMQHQISSEDATISYDFSEVTKVSTIRSYLHSILYNLILNAIKYKRKGVLPEINIKSSSGPQGIQLVISDNGTGIDLVRTKNDLFGMYKRFHPHIEGKGIGLFMVKTQVEILGGTISVESKVGEGTIFRILLPE